MKKNIAIVAGGDSSEIVVSLKSAEGIYSFIDKDKYNLYIAIVKKGEWAVKLPGGEHTLIDKNDFSFRENGEVKHFDFAYITIHGTPGEDGRLQGYFDLIGMPGKCAHWSLIRDMISINLQTVWMQRILQSYRQIYLCRSGALPPSRRQRRVLLLRWCPPSLQCRKALFHR